MSIFIYFFLLKGSLVYGHYGLPQDFDKLRFSNVNMTGVLVLLRSGKISFAEKVILFVAYSISIVRLGYFVSNLICNLPFILFVKVRNAEFAQAAGVLIYPDPSDFTFPSNANQDIESPFGHVSC